MITEVKRYISLWETRCYSEGLPDEAPNEIDDMVPSYKRIAVAILKNDLTHIGVAPITTKYYGILKSIELNKEYIKPKRMTQSELKESVFALIDKMIVKNCYIKGYGTLFRVCDQNHNPLQNITKLQMDTLVHNDIVILDRLVWRLNVLANPFAHQIDIKLPEK